MSYESFLPEGALINTPQNNKNTESKEALMHAMENRVIIEGIATLCDSSHNLEVDINGIRGVIPHNETALGIEIGKTKEIAIISRVGKPVCCTITGIENEDDSIYLKLSRAEAQRKALSHIFSTHSPGDVIPAQITHLEPFGAFVDIGCGIVSLIGIETLSVSRIEHPHNRFRIGDKIYTIITSIDIEKQRIFLSHRELLGTWSENVSKFEVGQTVRGIVRGIEDYGIFIELAPNLSGLAEFRSDIKVGNTVSVFIKSIIPEKMKIKLIVIDVFDYSYERYITKNDYFITSGHITKWKYSPDICTKKEISRDFS